MGGRVEVAREQVTARRGQTAPEGREGLLGSSCRTGGHLASDQSYIRCGVWLGFSVVVLRGPVPERASRGRLELTQSAEVHHGPGRREGLDQFTDCDARFIEGAPGQSFGGIANKATGPVLPERF